MDKERHKAERSTIGDRRRMHDALADPQNFYPRPQDVLEDDTLSIDDKRSLLRNWQVQLEDRAGALGQAGGPGEGHEPESVETHRALQEALARLGDGGD
jgi:hypothetical protein